MKKYNSLRSRVENNFFVILCFKFLFYFEMGRAQFGRFYGFIPELMIIIGFIKFVLEVDITAFQSIIFIAVLSTIFFFFGVFWKLSGLFDATVYVTNEKNPVMKEVYTAAKLINKHYGEENEGKV